MSKLIRVEFFHKGFYDFKNITEAKRWAKETQGEEIRTLFEQKYFTVREFKKRGTIGFTKEIERV